MTSANRLSARELRIRAAAQVDRLLRLPTQTQRVRRIRGHRRNYRNPFLVEDLLERSVRLARKPAKARLLVDLAQEIAESWVKDAGRAVGGMRRVFDHLALVHAFRANLYRLEQNFAESERYLLVAREWLEERGSNDPRIRVRILSLEASYLLNVLRFEDAKAVLLEGIRIGLASEAVDPVQVARLLLQLETPYRLSGEPERAIEALGQAADLLRDNGEPGLALVANHNLAFTLCDLGRISEACEVLRAAEPLYTASKDAGALLNRTWLQGRIHEAAGEWIEARRCFRAAREGFLSRNNLHDALLLTLALSGIELEHGRADSVARLAAEIHAFLEHDQLRHSLDEQGHAVLRKFLLAALERRASPILLRETLAAVTGRPHLARARQPR